MSENGILFTGSKQRHADMWTLTVTVDGITSEEDYETEDEACRALRVACDELDVAMMGSALVRGSVKVGSWQKGRY
ncbi:hypothetical protein [Mycobacterium phage WXIN]|nr:hypothetical protein [Mycobacterium phage WXIN]